MMQATGSSFFTQAMALATANTASTTLPELIAFIGSRLGQTRANQLLAKVGHLLTLEQQYTLQETYLYGSSRLGVKNQNTILSTRVASVQNGSLTPIGNAILNTDSVFSGTAAVYGLPKAPTARIFNRTWGLKQYELSNHLGNVQVTISDKKIGVVGANQVDFIAYEPEVKSATDYYAYGMEMPGKEYKSENYRFGFGGHETMNQVNGRNNVVDMGDRWLDVRLGRTNKMDAKAILFPGFSPYSYAVNSPLQAIDPDGKVVIFINGNHFGDGGTKSYWRTKRYKTNLIRDEFGISDKNISTRNQANKNGEFAFDELIKNQLNDSKSLYYDGALGGFAPFNSVPLSAFNRYVGGYKTGKIEAAKIIKNLARDRNGEIVETIKIVSHSMGGVFAKGFIDGLNQYIAENEIKNVKIEVELDFATFQSDDLLNEAVKGVPTFQFSHKFDLIAGSKKAPGANEVKTDVDLDQDHSIFSFEQSATKVGGLFKNYKSK